jgi:hypothetical protein
MPSWAAWTSRGALATSPGRAEELRDDAGQGIVLGNLAMVLRQTGRIQEARGRFEHALALKRKVGNRREEGITLGNLANLELNERAAGRGAGPTQTGADDPARGRRPARRGLTGRKPSAF